MSRSRGTLVAGIAAGLLANYWLLEGLLADRTNADGSWISDLGARSETTGLLFDLLDASSGVAIIVLAALLWAPFGSRSQSLRWGVIALAALGACTVIDGAAPLSCAEDLDPSCEIRWDAVDLVHGVESNLYILAGIAAFGLLGWGLKREAGLGSVANAALALGAVWFVLTGLTAGGEFLVDEIDSSKGIFHRGSQVVLGIWLVLLGWVGSRAGWQTSAPDSGADLRQPAVRPPTPP